MRRNKFAFAGASFQSWHRIKVAVVGLVEAHNNGTEKPVKEEEIGSEASKSPEPEWYLEKFRFHFGTIQALFKTCPPQQWKALSLALGDALDAVGKKVVAKATAPPTGEVQT
jgi:hypothetical protein